MAGVLLYLVENGLMCECLGQSGGWTILDGQLCCISAPYITELIHSFSFGLIQNLEKKYDLGFLVLSDTGQQNPFFLWTNYKQFQKTLSNQLLVYFTHLYSSSQRRTIEDCRPIVYEQCIYILVLIMLLDSEKPGKPILNCVAVLLSS